MLCRPTGKRLGFTIDSGKFHNVSLGQGQETVAEMALEKASREGHWVLLQVSITCSWRTLDTNTGRCPAQFMMIWGVQGIFSALVTPPKVIRGLLTRMVVIF